MTIELDADLGVDQNFGSPFGPKFLELRLKAPIREKLLECVNDHRLRDTPIEGLPSMDDFWLSGVTNGTFQNLSKKIDDEKFDGIVGKTICKLIKQYALNLMKYKPSKFDKFDEEYDFQPAAVWWNEMKGNDFLMLHHHKGDILDAYGTAGEISGNIYLKMPLEGLKYPQGSITWTYGGVETDLIDANMERRPETGQVYVWPSWVEHFVYPTGAPAGERIVLSFNGFWKRKPPQNDPPTTQVSHTEINSKSEEPLGEVAGEMVKDMME